MALFVHEAAPGAGLHTRAASGIALALNATDWCLTRLIVPLDQSVRLGLQDRQHPTADGRLVENFALWGERSSLAVEIVEPWSTDLLGLPATAVIALDPALFAEGAELHGPATATGHTWVEVGQDGDLATEGPVADRIAALARIGTDRYGRPRPNGGEPAPRRPETGLMVVVAGEREYLTSVYPAVLAALGDAADALTIAVDVHFASAEEALQAPDACVAAAHALILPGGADMAQVPAQIGLAAAALRQGLPTLGLCLGMQTMAVAVARHRAGLVEAHLEEVDPDAPIRLFEHMTDASGRTVHRLGDRVAAVDPDSRLAAILGRYGAERSRLVERTNHRYRLAPKFKPSLLGAGLAATAIDASADVVYAVEGRDGPLFLGFQGHPELLSVPSSPHPGLMALIDAARSSAVSRYDTASSGADAAVSVRGAKGRSS